MTKIEYIDDPLPTQGGTCFGYTVEYKNKYDRWTPVPIRKNRSGSGVPTPILEGGILTQIKLMGANQARAIAYWFKAECDADLLEDLHFLTRVRVVQYKINYDIKCYRSIEEHYEYLDREHQPEGTKESE